MLKLNPAAVSVVVDETRTALRATDHALLANAQMLASIIQGAESSNLPVGVTQDLYASILEHGGKLVEGRGAMRTTIRLLTAIKDSSDHRTVATGCPDGFPSLLEPERELLGAVSQETA